MKPFTKYLPLFLFLLTFQMLYANQNLQVFRIQCDPDSLEYIEQNFRKDILISASITHKKKTWKHVKLRLRGDSSRKQDKKSLKVVFDKKHLFRENRRKLNFNAEATDKSLIRSWLASKMFAEAGQTCFTAEHALLFVNDELYGIYLMIENMDTRFLNTRNLSPDNNLYKATNDSACLSIFDIPELHWEKKTNKKVPGFEDLELLIRQLDEVSDEEYYAFAQSTFKYREMVNILAMNMLLANHSTYYHNYYMYHDRNSGKWEMFPWDLDKTFQLRKADSQYQRGNRADKLWSMMPSNPFFERAIACPPILQDVQNRVSELENSIFNPDFTTPIIDSLENTLAPFIDQKTRFGTLSREEWEQELDEIKTYIQKRSASLREQFANSPTSFKLHRLPAKTSLPLTLSWEKPVDPNGDPIRYSLLISKDPKYPNDETWEFPDLSEPKFRLGKLPPGKYYWKVYATDGDYSVPGFDNSNFFTVSE